MPKKAINRTMINRVQKHLRQGHTPEAIATSYNIELGVVKAFTEENVAEVRETIRNAENVLHMEDKLLKDAEDLAKRERRQAAVKAAAKPKPKRKAGGTDAA